MRRAFVVAAFSSLFVVLLAPTVWAQDELDCSDFETQDAAQLVLDQDATDPNLLDEDGDGIACEEIDEAGGGGGDGNGQEAQGGRGNSDDEPRGGVESGLGGTAGSIPFMLLGAGAVIAAVLGGAVGAHRARSTR